MRELPFLLLLFAISVAMTNGTAQGLRAPIVPAPITIPAAPSFSPVQPSTAPATSSITTPPASIAPESSARAAAEKRMLEAANLFKYGTVTLSGTTTVTPQGDGTYSVSASFSVHGEYAAIRCTSTKRAAVDAFLEYIKRTFNAGSTANQSLETIVEGARKDIRNRPGLSDAQFTVQYIDPFKETHVVKNLPCRSRLAVA